MSDETLLPEPEQPNLIEVEPDWKEHWQGMPEYSHEDLMPWQTLMVHFKTPKDRQDFARLIGQQLHEKTKFVWHPKAEIRKASDKMYRSAKVTPRYPIYIISKGRWDSRLTQKALNDILQVPYHIVVEPQEYDRYAAVIPKDHIIVTPFSNLGQGGIPARNFVWEHAISTGAERHWILDDNISGFCRFQDNLKVEVDSGATFCAVEDFVDRYENVVMAAFNYDYFAPRKQGSRIYPITFNTRCYSGILLSNRIPHRWRGRYNEDTDLSLRILKDGLCTALFNAFLMYKAPTLTMKGGNTDELYKGVEAVASEWEAHAAECNACNQCVDGYPTEKHPRALPCDVGRAILSKDGRWLMAESLREQHPDQTTVERKWRRWQHQVDYRRFRNNKLILRKDIVIPEGTNDYGMELQAIETPTGNGNGAPKAAPTRTPQSKPNELVEPEMSILDVVAGMSEPEPAAVPRAEPARQVEAPRPEPTAARAEGQQPSEPKGAEPVQPSPADRAAALVAALRARGHRLFTRDGRLFTSDASRLSDEDRELQRELKAELIELAEKLPPTPVEHVDVTSLVAPAPALLKGIGEPVGPLHGTYVGEGQVATTQSLAQFLGSARSDWKPDEPPSLDGIDEVALNFATDGLEWSQGHRPVGVSVATLDGKMARFLPFRFIGGNLDEGMVKEWARRELRGKKITNAKTKFDIHMAREWGVDLEAQGCTFSDIQHTAALLDDNRKQFRLDKLAETYLPNEQVLMRVDEQFHHEHHAGDVAERELYTVRLVGKLRDVMYPMLDEQDLREVQKIEDDVIPAVVEMEKNGALIDVELLMQWQRECRAAYEKLLYEVSQEAGFAFEHTAKGWERLLTHLGFPAMESYAEGKLNRIDHPLVRKGQLASQHASLLSKVYDAYPKAIDSNGILRFDINQLASDEGGTVSGRFSIGYVQQVPNHDNHTAVFGDLWFPRRLFKSSTGLYLEADAAQIEYRFFAHYANNPEVIAAYAANPMLSFHKMTWEMMKKYKPDMLYTHQKSFNFAKQYGARSIKLATMMGFITEEEGASIRARKAWNDPRLDTIHEIEAAYKRYMPEGDELLDRAAHLLKPRCDEYCRRGDKLHRTFPHRGFVRTIAGRRSRSDTGYKAYIGLNRVIQGSGADTMKVKLAELHRARKDTGLLLRLTVHDAAGGDAQTPETLQKVDELLNTQSFPQVKVPIRWECGVGPTWADAKH